MSISIICQRCGKTILSEYPEAMLSCSCGQVHHRAYLALHPLPSNVPDYSGASSGVANIEDEDGG